MFAFTTHELVHLNAALNTVAAVLLLCGLRAIKRGRAVAHARWMLAAFAVSSLFLASYLTYHSTVRHVPFTHPGAVRYIYFAILISHIVLAALTPLLAIATVVLGFRALGWGPAAALADERRKQSRIWHRRLARVTFPIWMYVSITGVVIYLMLYHLWPPVAD